MTKKRMTESRIERAGFRVDWQTKSVYEFDKSQNAYVFWGKFWDKKDLYDKFRSILN